MRTFIPTIVSIVLITGSANHLLAAWQDEAGFTRLQLVAGAELPGAPSQGLSQTEAQESASAFEPDTTNALFSTKSFVHKSGTSGVSGHATHVATNFYGTNSFLPGTAQVDLYEVSNWLSTGFLNLSTSNAPLTENRAVQNHSWMSTSGSTSVDTDVSRRLDYAINTNGFVCAVGMSNDGTTTLPQLLGQTYNTISVGRDDGGHSAGFTTLDGAGRIKPDIVAPSAAPEYACSWTTPMVAGAAGLLVAKLQTSYSITGADRPRVAKALLLATATKNPNWANTSSRPLDIRYGSGTLNIHNAYQALRTGRATASLSTQTTPRGWAAESVPSNSSMSYFFTIPPGAPSTPFCAALTWHRVITDGQAGPSWGNLSASLANLSLRLYQANGFALGSVVAESLSTVDNVELVYQSALPSGTYALVVQNPPGSSIPYGLAWHSLPAVTIAATTSTAREIDGQTGLVTITRTGDTNLPLYVPLTASGTALAGTHYQAIPTSVTIPAGQSSTTVTITPISDNLAQGDRSVVVTPASDFASVHDSGQTATVTIIDKPFDAWRFANFTGPELAQPLVSAENADPDADQLANLIEYALGLPPKSSNTSPLLQSQTGGYLTLSTAKNTAATDILWSAEVTGDLSTWQPAVIQSETSSAFTARDSILSSSVSKRFIRLKITRP